MKIWADTNFRFNLLTLLSTLKYLSRDVGDSHSTLCCMNSVS